MTRTGLAVMAAVVMAFIAGAAGMVAHLPTWGASRDVSDPAYVQVAATAPHCIIEAAECRVAYPGT